MTIHGINGANTQIGQMGINQATDSYSRNIQNQIANAQKQLQELSSNEDMTLEEKMKKRQEIQQQISDLTMQLRQHQVEQRKEKQQVKGSSMENMPGGTRNAGNTKTGKSTGLSQASMTALISADSSVKQAKVQGNIASRFEGRAGVLEIEIKLDESRAVNGLSANTEGKKAELAEAEKKAMDVTADQMKTLGNVNKSLEEANKAEGQSDSKDTNVTSSKEKDEEKVSGADAHKKDASSAENEDTQSGVSALEDTSQAEAIAISQPKAYTSVDIRL